jgi:hypothetical protein
MPATYDFESLLDDVLDYGAAGKSGLPMVQAGAAYARDIRVSAHVYIRNRIETVALRRTGKGGDKGKKALCKSYQEMEKL